MRRLLERMLGNAKFTLIGKVSYMCKREYLLLFICIVSNKCYREVITCEIIDFDEFLKKVDFNFS